jgi:hypothetical protein
MALTVALAPLTASAAPAASAAANHSANKPAAALAPPPAVAPASNKPVAVAKGNNNDSNKPAAAPAVSNKPTAVADAKNANNAAATKPAANNAAAAAAAGARNAAAPAATARRPPAPLASSAILFYTKEYSEPQFGEQKTRCEQLVDAARAESGSDALNFVPTIYFEDDGRAPSGSPASREGPRASCKLDNWATVAHVGRFCYRRTWDAGCETPSAEDMDEFTRGLASCFAAAREAGFKKLLVSPHIDDALNKGLWRNMADFSPLAADQRGRSYWDVLLGPIVKAAAAAASASGAAAAPDGAPAAPPLEVLLGLQGEMGRPVFSDPAAWSAAARKSREAWSAAGAPVGDLKVGVLVPYRQIAGVANYGPAPASEPVAEPETPHSRFGGGDDLLPLAQWPLAEDFARTAPDLALLFRRDLDFLGISNYMKSGADVTAGHLDRAMKLAAAELKAASASAALDLGAMARGQDPRRRALGKGPLTLVWSEFGVGGGRSQCGDVPAASGAEAGRWPHVGMYGSWSLESDAWRGPRAAPDARAYRKAFHQAALDLLAEGGSPEFPLDSAFLWSLTSWDPQAIHPASRAPGGAPRSGYYDADIAGAIRAHNERAAAASAGVV